MVHNVALFFSGVVLGSKCLSRRDESGSQPSEDQFWPLPWGVGCNVGGCQEAVWFGCGFVSFLFHFLRINNFALLLSFYSTRCCSFFKESCMNGAEGVATQRQGRFATDPVTQLSRFRNKWYRITLTDCNANHASSIFAFMH